MLRLQSVRNDIRRISKAVVDANYQPLDMFRSWWPAERLLTAVSKPGAIIGAVPRVGWPADNH